MDLNRTWPNASLLESPTIENSCPFGILLRTNSETDLNGLSRKRRKSDGFLSWRPSKDIAQEMRDHISRLKSDLGRSRLQIEDLKRNRIIEINKIREEEATKCRLSCLELEYKLNSEKDKQLSDQYDHLVEDLHKQLTELADEKDEIFRKAQEFWNQEKDILLQNLYGEIRSETRHHYDDEYERIRRKFELQLISLSTDNQQLENELKVLRESERRRVDEFRNISETNRQEVEKMKKKSSIENKQQLTEIKHLNAVIRQLEEQLGIGNDTCMRLQMEKECLDEEFSDFKKADSWERRSQMSTMKRSYTCADLNLLNPTWSPRLDTKQGNDQFKVMQKKNAELTSLVRRLDEKNQQLASTNLELLEELDSVNKSFEPFKEKAKKLGKKNMDINQSLRKSEEKNKAISAELSDIKAKYLTLQDQSYKKDKQLLKLKEKNRPTKVLNDSQKEELIQLRSQKQQHLQIIAELQHENTDKERRIELLKSRKRLSKNKSKSLQSLDQLHKNEETDPTWIDERSKSEQSYSGVSDASEEEERVKRLIVERIHLEKAYMQLQEQVGGTTDPERAEQDYTSLQEDLANSQSVIDDMKVKLKEANERLKVFTEKEKVTEEIRNKLFSLESELVTKDLSMKNLREKLKEVEDQKELLEFRIVEMDSFYQPKPRIKKAKDLTDEMEAFFNELNFSSLSVRLTLKEIELTRYDDLSADERTALLQARQLIENGDKVLSMIDANEEFYREATKDLEKKYHDAQRQIHDKNSEIKELEKKVLSYEEKSLFKSLKELKSPTIMDDLDLRKRELSQEADKKIADLKRTNESLVMRLKRFEESKKLDFSGDELSMLATKMDQLVEAEKKIYSLEASNMELVNKLKDKQDDKIPSWYDSADKPELVSPEIAKELVELKEENISLKSDLSKLRITSEEAYNSAQEAKAALKIKTTACQTDDEETGLMTRRSAGGSSSQGAQTDSTFLDPSYLISRLGSEDDVFETPNEKDHPQDIIAFENLVRSCAIVGQGEAVLKCDPISLLSNGNVFNAGFLDSVRIRETLSAIIAGLPKGKIPDQEKNENETAKLESLLTEEKTQCDRKTSASDKVHPANTDDIFSQESKQKRNFSKVDNQGKFFSSLLGRLEEDKPRQHYPTTVNVHHAEATPTPINITTSSGNFRPDSGYTTERDDTNRNWSFKNRSTFSASETRTFTSAQQVEGEETESVVGGVDMTTDSDVERLLAFGNAIKRENNIPISESESPSPLLHKHNENSLDLAVNNFLFHNSENQVSPQKPLSSLKPLSNVDFKPEPKPKSSSNRKSEEVHILSSSFGGNKNISGERILTNQPSATSHAANQKSSNDKVSNKWDFTAYYHSLSSDDTLPHHHVPVRGSHMRSKSADSVCRMNNSDQHASKSVEFLTPQQFQCQGRLYTGSTSQNRSTHHQIPRKAAVQQSLNTKRVPIAPCQELSTDSPLTSSTPQDEESLDESTLISHADINPFMMKRRRSYPILGKSQKQETVTDIRNCDNQQGRLHIRSKSCEINLKSVNLPKDVKLLKQQCESLERQLKNKDVIMRSMKAELKEELESIAILEKKEKIIQERTEKCHFLTQELKKRERELEGKVCEITKRDALIYQLRCDIKKLEEDKRSVEHTYREVQTQVTRLESSDRRLIHLQSQYDGVCQKNADLKEKIKILQCTEKEYYELEKSVCALQEQLRDMESVEKHRDELYQKLVIIKKQRDEYLEKGKLVECERNDFLHSSKTMEQCVEEYKCKIESLKSSNTTLQQKIIMIEKEKDELESTIATCHQENTVLHSKLTKIECQRDTLIRDLRDMTSEKCALEQRLKELEEMLGDQDKLEEGFHSLRIKLAELTRQRDDAELFIPTLKAKISLLKKACREKDEEITRLREQCRFGREDGGIPDSWLRKGERKSRATSFFQQSTANGTYCRPHRSSSAESLDSYEDTKHRHHESKSHRHKSKQRRTRELKMKKYRALFDYDPYTTGTSDHPEKELKLKEGDYVTVYGEVDIDGYLEAEIDGVCGLVPSIYVEEDYGFAHGHSQSVHQSSSHHSHGTSQHHHHGSQSRTEYVVLRDYDPFVIGIKRPEMHLCLRKNDIITVIGGIDVDGFYTAEYKGRTGLIPSTYVRRFSSHSDGHKHTQQSQQSESIGFKGQIELEQDNVVGPPYAPKDLKIIRVLSKDTVLLGWAGPSMDDCGRSNGALVTGYKLWFNGAPKQDIDSPYITKAIMEDICMDGRIEFSIQTVAENGFCSEKCHFAITGALALLSDDECYSSIDTSTRTFVALYDYDPLKSSPNPNPTLELSFKEGDLIKIIDMTRSDGFYQAEIRGKRGLVPSNFIEEISMSGMQHTNSHSHKHQSSGSHYNSYSNQYSGGKQRKMMVLYDYDPLKQSPSKDKSKELTLLKGQEVTVFGDMRADGFYAGESNGQQGLVPGDFLQTPNDDEQESRRVQFAGQKRN